MKYKKLAEIDQKAAERIEREFKRQKRQKDVEKQNKKYLRKFKESDRKA